MSMDDFAPVLNKSQKKKQKQKSTQIISQHMNLRQRGCWKPCIMSSSFKEFYWNVKGVANLATQRYITQLCRYHRPNLICIVGPWTIISVVKDFWSALGLR